jgi:hypothetical protein
MDPSNSAVIFDTGIHRLETGVPLLVASEGDEEPMKSIWLTTQKTNNAPASFKRLPFIYGFFASLNLFFGVNGFIELFVNFMLVLQGESSKSSIVKQFSGVLFWVGLIYITVMIFLNIDLMRFGFDVTTTTDKEADDAEDLDTPAVEEIVSICKAYFLLGWCLVSEAYKFRRLKSNNTFFDVSHLLPFVILLGYILLFSGCLVGWCRNSFGCSCVCHHFGFYNFLYPTNNALQRILIEKPERSCSSISQVLIYLTSELTQLVAYS